MSSVPFQVFPLERNGRSSAFAQAIRCRAGVSRLQDDGGSTASGQINVIVDDAPIGVSVLDPGATEGQPANNAIIGTLSDGNTYATASDFSGTIDWGDGPNGPDGTDVSDATFQATSTPGVFNIIGNHTYAEDGGYDVVISATDDGGSSNTSSGYINVADAPISLSPEPQIRGTEGLTTGLVTVATLNDTNLNAPISDFANNVTITWGDGNTSQATLAAQGPGVFLVQGFNTYAEEGIYNLTVTASDAGGSVAPAVPPTLVDIHDAPISLTPTPVGVIEQVPTGTMTIATLNDTNTGNTDATDFSGTFQCSDGTNGQLSFVNQSPGVFAVQIPDHTFADEGTFAVNYVAQDIGQAPPASNTTMIAVGEGAMGVSLGASILSASNDGTQNLVPLSITTHYEPEANWALSITASGAQVVDVWTTPNPGSGDTPVLGMVNGSVVTTMYWSPGDTPPGMLYVGAYAASASIGDIQFALSEGEPNAPGTTMTSQTATAVALNTLKATDDSDPSNTVTATHAAPTQDLYVAEDPTSLTATVDLSATIAPSGLGAQGLWQVDGSSASPTSGNFTSSSTQVVLTPTDDNYDFTINAGIDANGDGTLQSNEVTRTVNVHVFNLTADTVMDNTGGGDLPKADQNTTGAFVPLNNGDDNYDGRADNEEVGAISGEDHLLPIVLHEVGGNDPGNYTLQIPDNVEVWRNSDRSGAIDGTTEIPAGQDNTLYVEGTQTGTGTLTADWSNTTATVNNAAVLKVTTFYWLGPLNVPGYGIFNYDAAGALSTSQWVDPSDGTIQTGGGTSDVSIQWGGGPVVGRAAYQVDGNYTWDIDVNVVQVVIAAPTTAGSVAFQPGQPTDRGTAVDNGILSKFVAAGVPVIGQTGLQWAANVTLNGPDGGRGVAQMRVGFIQNGIDYQNQGYYTSMSRLVSSVVGTITPLSPILDSVNAGPWYSTAGNSVFFNPTPAANSQDITSNDTPQNGPPIDFEQDGAVVAGDDILAHMQLQYSFQLDLCVQTTDTQNAANGIYTRRATASWSFNGSGDIDPTTYAWKAGNDAGINSPSAWTDVTDGSQPGATAGPTFNDKIQAETFAPPFSH